MTSTIRFNFFNNISSRDILDLQNLHEAFMIARKIVGKNQHGVSCLLWKPIRSFPPSLAFHTLGTGKGLARRPQWRGTWIAIKGHGWNTWCFPDLPFLFSPVQFQQWRKSFLSEECSLIKILNPPEVCLPSTVVWSLDLRTEGNGHKGITGAQGFPYLVSFNYGGILDAGISILYPTFTISRCINIFSPSSGDLRDLDVCRFHTIFGAVSGWATASSRGFQGPGAANERNELRGPSERAGAAQWPQWDGTRWKQWMGHSLRMFDIHVSCKFVQNSTWKCTIKQAIESPLEFRLLTPSPPGCYWTLRFCLRRWYWTGSVDLCYNTVCLRNTRNVKGKVA